MGRFVAFLRAVNVGPRRVAMATARRVLVDLGYQDVASYVNSANLLFSSLGKTEDLTFVRTAKEVQTLVVDKPFSLAGQDAHFVLLPLKRMSPNEQTAVLNMAN